MSHHEIPTPYYETPKPQSILHQIGRLGCKIAKPLTKSKKTKSDNNKKISTPRDGVYSEDDIVLEHDETAGDDFSSVSSDGYEENFIEECDILPQAQEKCDGSSQDGKVLDKVPGDETCSDKDRRRRNNSRRIDSTGIVA